MLYGPWKSFTVQIVEKCWQNYVPEEDAQGGDRGRGKAIDVKDWLEKSKGSYGESTQ